MKLEEAYTLPIINLAENIDRKEDPLIQFVRMHQHNMNSAVLQKARCGNTSKQKCHAKGSDKEVKIQKFRYRDTTNVELEMYD